MIYNNWLIKGMSTARIRLDRSLPSRFNQRQLIRVASQAFRLPGSLLPRPGESVAQVIDELHVEQLNLSEPTVFARGKVYLVKLQEIFSLPSDGSLL